MSDWERDLHAQPTPAANDHSTTAPVLQSQPSLSRPTGVSRLGSKSRRQLQTIGTVSDDPTSSSTAISRPIIPQRPMLPSRTPTYDPNQRQQQQQQQQQQHEDDDPFAVHSQPSSQPSASSQPFVHPLMADSFRSPMTAAQQQQQQQDQWNQQQQYQQQQLQQYYHQQQQCQQQPHPQSPQRDPHLQRIESTLRDTLTRDPSTFQNRQLPPLSRPDVPPLKLGDVINKVLGPRALTNPSAAPAISNQLKIDLREKVARMKLHETINPALAPTGDPMAGLEPDRAEYIDTGVNLDYDENDDDEAAGGGVPDAAGGLPHEQRPLSPRRNLGTSRLPIDPEDLARRPDELRDLPIPREELMHFRRNQPSGSIGITSAGSVMGGAVSNTQQASDPTKLNRTQPQLQETFVESKTTGEFIRVRAPPMDVSANANQQDPSHHNVHNIHEFDHQIDTIIDSVNSVQGHLSAVWLLMSGLLVGACLIQVYLVYLKDGNSDFLSYYSRFAGAARKVIYVLNGFAVTLACWRYLLERYDADRHIHFITRYHIPNSHPWIWIRNVVCAVAFGLGFLMTLIMVPLDDYMETQWQTDHYWYASLTTLPDYFTSRIDSWYAMSMVRLIFVGIGFICVLHRFWRAEFQFYQLEQEKYEGRNRFNSGTIQPLQSIQTMNNTSGLNRTSRGMTNNNVESSIPTARSSRLSTSQRGGAVQMELLNASTMNIPPRR